MTSEKTPNKDTPNPRDSRTASHETPGRSYPAAGNKRSAVEVTCLRLCSLAAKVCPNKVVVSARRSTLNIQTKKLCCSCDSSRTVAKPATSAGLRGTKTVHSVSRRCPEHGRRDKPTAGPVAHDTPALSTRTRAGHQENLSRPSPGPALRARQSRPPATRRAARRGGPPYSVPPAVRTR